MTTTIRGVPAALAAILLVAPASAQSPAAMPRFLSDAPAGARPASAMVGLTVMGMDHEDLGRTEDIVIDGEGRVQAVVVRAGGFLGIGQKRVAIPFDQVVWVPPEGASGSELRSSTGPDNAPSAREAHTAGPSTMPGAQVSNDVLITVDEKRGGRVDDATGSVLPKDQPRGRATVPVTASSGGPVRAKVRLTKAMIQAAPAYAGQAEAAR